jgi:hypothetical protein
MGQHFHRVGFITITILVFFMTIGLGGKSPIQRAADSLLGERSYHVYLHDEVIGHYKTSAKISGATYRFETNLVFQLGHSNEVRITDTLVFDKAVPHHLIEAKHNNKTTAMDIKIARRSGSLMATVHGRDTELPWDYKMGEYLALESWLGEKRELEDNFIVHSVDFDQLSLATNTWHVIGENDVGYRLRKVGFLDKTEVQLDSNLAPVRFNMADLFLIERVNAANETLSREDERSILHSSRYMVPLDQSIEAPRELTKLVLKVRAKSDANMATWPSLRRDEYGEITLVSHSDERRPVQYGEVERLTRETITYPSREREIERLASRATAGKINEIGQLEALVYFVNEYLSYEDHSDIKTVAETLKARRGGCTEFANLLTTMARSIGFPAQTVFGLAYSEDTNSFALHTWNEVAIDGWWYAVDPTWRQVSLDATHLALPSEGELAVLGLLGKLEFELLETQYRRDQAS